MVRCMSSSHVAPRQGIANEFRPGSERSRRTPFGLPSRHVTVSTRKWVNHEAHAIFEHRRVAKQLVAAIASWPGEQDGCICPYMPVQRLNLTLCLSH